MNFKTTFSSNFFWFRFHCYHYYFVTQISVYKMILKMNQMVTQIWWFKRMVAVVTIPNYLHILADILYVGKITPVDAIQQISVNKMFCSICRIANYSVDNVNHPSNNQGQVFWTQRRQYCYVVLPVPFLLGWLFGSMSCRFLYTHPATTDPKRDKSL